MVKRAAIFCLILYVLFLFVSPLSAQTRESWQKLERNGQGYGFDHIIAKDLANGNTRYEIYQTIKTDIAGYNPQEITQKGFYIVDKDMNPVSFDIHIQGRAKRKNAIFSSPDQ